MDTGFRRYGGAIDLCPLYKGGPRGISPVSMLEATKGG